MNTLGVIVDKGLRNTVLVSMALHMFCLSFVSFTFVDKIYFSMDLNVDFLGSLLKESDILINTVEKKDYVRMGILDNFFTKPYDGLEALDYHLVVNKPNRKSGNLFLEKKNSVRFIYIFPKSEIKEELKSETIEEIGEAPEWDKGLKLKIE
ncbi:MAG: hypothetical protein ABH954_05590 [Candidatus Omnitrophota bacterium]